MSGSGKQLQEQSLSQSDRDESEADQKEHDLADTADILDNDVDKLEISEPIEKDIYDELAEEAISYPDILTKEIFEPNQPWQKWKQTKQYKIEVSDPYKFD